MQVILHQYWKYEPNTIHVYIVLHAFEERSLAVTIV